MNKFRKNKSIRRTILILLDLVLILLSYNINFLIINYNNLKSGIGNINIFQMVLYTLICIFTYIFSGQYKSISQYISKLDLYRLLVRNTFSLIIFIIILKIFLRINLEYNNLFLLWIFSNLFTCSIRIITKEIYTYSKYKNNSKKSVAIYGAGEAGVLLNYLLTHNDSYKVLAFIDDSPRLTGREISGVPIYSPNQFYKTKTDIKTVFLSIPSLNNRRKREIINELESNNISVFKIPSLSDIKEGKARIDDLKPVEIDDVLDRDLVKADKNIMLNSIEGFNICITGAGGSIGSELCKEILKLNPNKLVILERNEPSLYKIENELNNFNQNKVEIISHLGCAANKSLVNNIFKNNNIDIVFHSAAYKHVDIVQRNPVQGILNNISSTLNICYQAKENELKKVILISTDKAVRPKNVMGASKRLCEMIIQAFSEQQFCNDDSGKNHKIIFSKVRFGNVLGSSGSVVPLFKKQLEAGGPITLTHKEVVRYFMTINEAVQLVIQTAALAKGGDLFLLNMGKSVKIYDLAKKMIRLSGLTIKDENNPDGDVEIIITGLRPGEKLYEELLVEKNSEATIHPLIFKAQDQKINSSVLFQKLNELELALSSNNESISLKILSQLVPEWS